ncbi:hypothetical protein [Paraclostridium sordellii]|nr:hypothetical protein [Paeniclostridium sordellii]
MTTTETTITIMTTTETTTTITITTTETITIDSLLCKSHVEVSRLASI